MLLLDQQVYLGKMSNENAIAGLEAVGEAEK